MKINIRNNLVGNHALERSKINWYFLFLLEAFPLVVPDGLANISSGLFTLVYVYWKLASYGLIIVEFFVLSCRRKRLPKMSLAFIIVFAYLAVLTFLKKGSISTLNNNLSIAVITVMLLENKKTHLDRVLSVYLVILEFWIYLNLILMILIPNGMYMSEVNRSYKCWILGYKSSFQYYILPAICFLWIKTQHSGNRMRFLLLLIVSVYEAVASGNAMLVVGIALVLLFFFFPVFKLEKVFNMRNYLLIVLVANIVYVFFTTQLLTSGMAGSLLEILGKDATLSSRISVILPRTLEVISEEWLVGCGVLSNSDRYRMYGGFQSIHAHNQMLEIMVIGGVILLAAYILFNLVVTEKLMKHKEKPTAQIFALSIFVLYIMMIVEVFTRRIASPIWCMLILAYYCDKVDEAFICEITAQRNGTD